MGALAYLIMIDFNMKDPLTDNDLSPHLVSVRVRCVWM